MTPEEISLDFFDTGYALQRLYRTSSGTGGTCHVPCRPHRHIPNTYRKKRNSSTYHTSPLILLISHVDVLYISQTCVGEIEKFRHVGEPFERSLMRDWLNYIRSFPIFSVFRIPILSHSFRYRTAVYTTFIHQHPVGTFTGWHTLPEKV